MGGGGSKKWAAKDITKQVRGCFLDVYMWVGGVGHQNGRGRLPASSRGPRPPPSRCVASFLVCVCGVCASLYVGLGGGRRAEVGFQQKAGGYNRGK